jgi:hypothetical protein
MKNVSDNIFKYRKGGNKNGIYTLTHSYRV